MKETIFEQQLSIDTSVFGILSAILLFVASPVLNAQSEELFLLPTEASVLKYLPWIVELRRN